LYFYPKDDTSGCTLEAQGFNTLLPEFEKPNTQIIGVSKDEHKSHCKFQDKHGLKIALISDTDLVLHTDPRFDTRKEKSMYGRKYMGTMRESFLLDKSGEIIYKWAKVTPASHPQEVLTYISNLTPTPLHI
jgi:thioredoxin-dependent peroxiredoxin